MTSRTLSGLSSRASRINDTTYRILVALRNETRALGITNHDVAQMLELAEILATAIEDGCDDQMSETHVIARACGALDAQRAATGDLAAAIGRIRCGVDDLLR